MDFDDDEDDVIRLPGVVPPREDVTEMQLQTILERHDISTPLGFSSLSVEIGSMILCGKITADAAAAAYKYFQLGFTAQMAGHGRSPSSGITLVLKQGEERARGMLPSYTKITDSHGEDGDL